MAADTAAERVPPGDTLAGDTTRALADSVAARLRDSLGARPDSSRLQRYLAAEALGRVRVPVPHRLELDGPAPALSRLVLTRDSIDWGHAATLADLLQRVPGVYLWRGGWTGQPEYANYQARGPTAVEYYLDGLPYIAAGTDSVGIDPSLLPLSLLDRIEIDRWPGMLRVRLFTLAHDRLAPRSRIAVGRGAADFARYQGTLEKRSRSGLGFAVAAENTDLPEASGIRPRFGSTSILARGTWLPSSRTGLLLQYVRTRPDRDPVFESGTDTLSRGFVEAKRSDWQVRAFWRQDTTALGPRIDLLGGRLRASDSIAPTQELWQVGVVGSLRGPTASVGASAFWRSRWTSLDARLTGGWSPFASLTVGGEVTYQRHDGGRTSRWAGARAGVSLPYGLELAASGRVGEAVAAPAIGTDSARSLRDWQATAALRRSWIELEGGYARTAAFAPFPYQPYAQIVAIAPSATTEWITARGRLTPLSWLTVEGWYSNPRTGSPEGLPPRHSLAAGTIRTRLQRIFPSGVLDLKLRLAVEHWSNGVLGRNAAGDPVPVAGATFFRSLVQVALGSLQFYWDRANLATTERAYVPGLSISGRPSEFGVRWTFMN
ncbi:MAG TPA: TonB-dependent receptor plug domain-containing protein [Gemmatimonadales bacterium]|nr:TonB-dependent receptor plug domain-containing protein [Gemmatimonadales bacterium]